MINIKDKVKITERTTDEGFVEYKAELSITSTHFVDSKVFNTKYAKDMVKDVKNQLIYSIHRELYGELTKVLYEKISNLSPWRVESFGEQIEDILRFVRKLERCEPITNDKGVL